LQCGELKKLLQSDHPNETTIVWDRETSEPGVNAIVWQDQAGTAKYCDELKQQAMLT
jgi:glycerol kinase